MNTPASNSPRASLNDTAPANAMALRTVPGTAPEIRLEGRIDQRTAKGPVLIWQGSRASLDFTGRTLTLLLQGGGEQAHLDLEVDGVHKLISLKGGKSISYKWPEALDQGPHRMVLTKRSEAMAGNAQLLSLTVEDKATLAKPQAEGKSPRLLFIGDSITVGACNEDGAEDQWEDRSTHNNMLSYGKLTSTALGADYRCIAVSGMGICEGYVPILAHQAWNRLYPEVDAPVAEPEAGWTPEVIFVNLGENDSSFSNNAKHPFPAGFTDGYVALIKAIREANPGARIVLLRGGMGGGANNPDLKRAWDQAIIRIAKADTKVSHFVFKHWSNLHPRVADDRAMAAELSTWLKAQPWFGKASGGR